MNGITFSPEFDIVINKGQDGFDAYNFPVYKFEIYKLGVKFLDKYIITSISKNFNMFSKRTYWEVTILNSNSGKLEFKDDLQTFLEWLETQKT